MHRTADRPLSFEEVIAADGGGLTRDHVAGTSSRLTNEHHLERVRCGSDQWPAERPQTRPTPVPPPVPAPAAIAAVRRFPPGRDRDYHPGNVLWQHDQISGIVDWEAASIGPPDIDIGDCRANLVQYGREALVDFTAAWERTAGLTYDPWADIGALIGCLDGFHESAGPERFAVEDVLAAAVAELN